LKQAKKQKKAALAVVSKTTFLLIYLTYGLLVVPER